MPLAISAYRTEEKKEINELINELKLDMSLEKVLEIIDL